MLDSIDQNGTVCEKDVVLTLIRTASEVAATSGRFRSKATHVTVRKTMSTVSRTTCPTASSLARAAPPCSEDQRDAALSRRGAPMLPTGLTHGWLVVLKHSPTGGRLGLMVTGILVLSCQQCTRRTLPRSTDVGFSQRRRKIALLNTSETKKIPTSQCLHPTIRSPWNSHGQLLLLHCAQGRGHAAHHSGRHPGHVDHRQCSGDQSKRLMPAPARLPMP